MKYTVSIAIDSRIDIDVEAENTEDARVKALEAFATADLTTMDIVGRSAVNCSDEDGNIICDYE